MRRGEDTKEERAKTKKGRREVLCFRSQTAVELWDSFQEGVNSINVLDNKRRRKVSKCDSKKVTSDLKEEVSRVWRWQSDCKELKHE